MDVKKHKVLVVEDDDFVAGLYKMKLEHDGFEVRVAKNGKLGVAAYDTFSPEIIILDILMPETDGFYLLEELKVRRKVQTPVYVLSNLGQKDDIDKAMQMGATNYLIKIDTSINSVSEAVKSELGL